MGLLDCLELGNLDAKRDWGYAQDYVQAMWLMLQQETADDYVVATGETRTIREFAETAFGCVGVNLRWEGSGENETGIDESNGQVILRVNPKFYRPAEVEILLGSPAKAEQALGWRRAVPFAEMTRRMVENDLRLVQAEKGLPRP
jgi:GDPmannose 4,6-dehydratase